MKKSQAFQRLAEVHAEYFQDIISLNLELINKNQPVIPFPPDLIEKQIPTTWLNYITDLQLCYD